MVHIAYFTELNLQICDYAQKRRFCRKNCKYGLDENFHGHFAPDERLSSSAILVDKMDFLTSFSWFLVLFSFVTIKIPRFLSEFLSLCFFVNNSVPAGPTSPFSFCVTSEEIYITVHQPKSLLWHLSSIPILFLPKGEQPKNFIFSIVKKHNIFFVNNFRNPTYPVQPNILIVKSRKGKGV